MTGCGSAKRISSFSEPRPPLAAGVRCQTPLMVSPLLVTTLPVKDVRLGLEPSQGGAGQVAVLVGGLLDGLQDRALGAQELWAAVLVGLKVLARRRLWRTPRP